MVGNLRQIRKRARKAFYYQVLPAFVDFLAVLSTIAARRRLERNKVGPILVDNTILFHAVTHESTWVATGPAAFGGLAVDTGYAARIPVHSDDDKSDAVRSVRYLPGIASLTRRGHLRLAISDELVDERLTQLAGRFVGYGYYDYSLLSDIELERIRDPGYTITIGSSSMRLPSLKEQRKKRLGSKADPLYRNLVSVLGSRNSQDAWHIFTAERCGCYCFLTMDFNLMRNVRAQSNNKVLKSLKTRIMTPEEFGTEFGIYSISPRYFSYHSASFPVLHTENWPDSIRQKP